MSKRGASGPNSASVWGCAGGFAQFGGNFRRPAGRKANDFAVVGSIAFSGVFQDGIEIVIELRGYFFANALDFGNYGIRTHG